jgi:hypothetical protein
MEDVMDSIWDTARVLGNQTIWGVEVKDGAVVERIETAEFHNSLFQFPAIILWKLYIKMAKEFEADATTFCTRFESKFLNRRTPDKKKIYSLRAANTEDATQYFQSIIAAHIISYCALEAYVNCRIDSFYPSESDYIAVEQLTKEVHAGGFIKIKEDLIRECSLEEKLFYILPYFLRKRKIDLSKIESFKRDFGLLTFVRNALVHLNRLKVRTRQLEDGKIETAKLWNYLIPIVKKNSTTLNLRPAQLSVELIGYIEKACGNAQS